MQTLDLFPATPATERIFLGWDRPALPAAAAVLADHYAAAGVLRLDRATVVLSGGRAGRRLKELLLEQAEERGLRLVPPRTVTLRELPELLHEPRAPLAPRALARRSWARVLRRLAPPARELLFRSPPPEEDLLGWATLARTMERLHADVGSAGLRFRDVVGRCADGLLWDDAPRWTALAAAQDDYAGELAGLGYADRDLARIEALERRSLRLDGDLWLLGVAEMPRVVQRMLAAIPSGAADVRALVHAPESEADAFDGFGCVRPAAWLAREIPIADAQLAVCGRPDDQAREAVRVLAGLGGRYAADEIAVAVPDRELKPYLEQQLEAAGVPSRGAEGAPLERTGPYRLLAAVADYLDGRRFEACAALARHPDLRFWLRRAALDERDPVARGRVRADAWLEQMDAYFGRHLPARVDGFPAAARGAAAATLMTFCRLLDERLAPAMPDATTGPGLAGWMEAILGVLVEVYGGRTLELARPADRGLLDALGPLAAAAAELRALPPGVDEPCSVQTAIRMLLDECAEARVAGEAGEAAVELLGWLEMHLDDTPVAVVTGFNEGMLPQSVNADAFLPNSLRSRLGLVDNDRRCARDAYELTALLRSREQVHLIAGRRTASGDPLRPSRLMLAVRGPSLAGRILRFYGDEAPAAPAVPDSEASPVAAREPVSRFRLPPEPVLALASLPAKLAVTAFRTLLQDPYGYALSRRIGGDPVDDAARELDPLGFGGLAHRVLERFGRSAAARSAEPPQVRATLDRLLDELAADAFGRWAQPSVRIQIEQLRARLSAFAGWQANRVAQGWRTVGVECSTPQGGVAFEVDGEPIALTGRIDRIDHHAGLGAWAVFDYKTGDNPTPPEQTHLRGRGDARRWVDLQLPLYRHLVPHVVDDAGERPFTGDAASVIQFGYLALPRSLEQTGPLIAGWSEDELAGADETARAVVRMLRANRWEWDGSGGGFEAVQLAALLGRGNLRSAAIAAEEADW